MEINYPVQMTDAEGYFTTTVTGLPIDVYDYRVKGPKYLANAGNVFRRGTEFHCDHRFRNQFRRHRSDNMDTENFICLRIGQEFHV